MSDPKSKKMLIFGIFFFFFMTTMAIVGVYTDSPLDNPALGDVAGKNLW